MRIEPSFWNLCNNAKLRGSSNGKSTKRLDRIKRDQSYNTTLTTSRTPAIILLCLFLLQWPISGGLGQAGINEDKLRHGCFSSGTHIVCKIAASQVLTSSLTSSMCLEIQNCVFGEMKNSLEVKVNYVWYQIQLLIERKTKRWFVWELLRFFLSVL